MNDNNISAAKTPLRRKIYVLFHRFLFAISRKQRRDGIEIATLFRDKKSLVVFSKINQALNLISEYDPRRYLQIRRDVKKIWVFTTRPAVGLWMDKLQMCILDTDFYCRNDASASSMALTLVHEATHAHLNKLKIKSTEDIRDRVERVCIKSEIAFAKRLPDGQKLAEMAELRLKIPKSFYSDAQYQQRELNALGELRKTAFAARILYPIVKRIVDKRNARLQSRDKD